MRFAQVISKIRKIRFNPITFVREILFFARFFFLLIFYLFKSLFTSLAKIWGIGIIFKPFDIFFTKLFKGMARLLDSKNEGEISSADLILLAARHLKVKKTRTFVTIGGMAIGFGSVIYLLSLGYGFQRLVVSQVARLGEMKQADVSIGQASSLKLNNQAVSDFKAIDKVTLVLPQISVVSKVSFNNSVSDVVAFGVTTEFLEQSAIQPSRGKIFENGDEVSLLPEESPESQGVGVVAGAQTERVAGAKMGKETAQVRYSLYPLVWKPVYKSPSQQSILLGYSRRIVGEQEATEVWGNTYKAGDAHLEGFDDFGNVFHRWVKDAFPLWKKEDCDEKDFGCVDGAYMQVKEGGSQVIAEGFMTEDELTIDRFQIIQETSPQMTEGEVVRNIQFSLDGNQWVEVFQQATKTEKSNVRYTQLESTDDLVEAELVWGAAYSDVGGWGAAGQNIHGQSLGYWIRAEMPLWEKIDCGDCENYYLVVKDSSENQKKSVVYFPANQANIEDMIVPEVMGKVLGEATSSASLAESSVEDDEEASDSANLIASTEVGPDGLDWVTISSSSGSLKKSEKDVLSFQAGAKKQAIVNLAMLKLLALSEDEALGKKFNVVFMLDGSFFDKEEYQAESEEVMYEIVGIIPEEKTPAFYLPLNDLKGLGIKNYSQMKVVVEEQDDLKGVRQTIESLGYKTTSVVDTVGRINSLFGTVRMVLFSLGLVALGVASLGMFNTLTVSLLEKTREVGLMKAMGMKSHEVKRLFLAESIIMGISGGIVGLLLGYSVGKLTSVFFSAISLSKGLGIISVVYIPPLLILAIVILSFVIGVLTGLYPSRRATKISALNALRYE